MYRHTSGGCCCSDGRDLICEAFARHWRRRDAAELPRPAPFTIFFAGGPLTSRPRTNKVADQIAEGWGDMRSAETVAYAATLSFIVRRQILRTFESIALVNAGKSTETTVNYPDEMRAYCCPLECGWSMLHVASARN
jgi:hypothetical protein